MILYILLKFKGVINWFVVVFLIIDLVDVLVFSFKLFGNRL